MRSLFVMPTLKQYAERRPACVKEAVKRRFCLDFSYFRGPESYYPEARVSNPVAVNYDRKTRAHAADLDKKSRAEQRREPVRFARDYGKGLRQKTVREKSKEMTGSLPYAVTWRPEESEEPREVQLNLDLDREVVVPRAGGVPVKTVRSLFREGEAVAVLAPRTDREAYWVALVKVSDGSFRLLKRTAVQEAKILYPTFQ